MTLSTLSRKTFPNVNCPKIDFICVITYISNLYVKTLL